MQKRELLNGIIGGLHKKLINSARQYWYNRGINDETLDYFKIGFDGKRYYIFPYFDENKDCYLYKAISVEKDQYWYPSGYADAIRIYNIADIGKARCSGDTLYKAEGEKDTFVLKMHGCLCVGIPGVNAFEERYVSLFEGVKRIIVCFDNDEPGQKGGEKIVNLLNK